MQKSVSPEIEFIINYIIDAKSKEFDLASIKEKIERIDNEEKKTLVRVMEILIMDILHPNK
jgi:hypothetical protein